MIRLLILEDDPIAAAMVKRMLKPADVSAPVEYEVVHRTSLSEGFAQLSTSQFDVLMLDLGLPDSKGIDTLLRVIAGRTNIPVVVSTADNDPQIESLCLLNGAQDYLLKGQFNSSGLRRTLRNAVSRAQHQRESRRRTTTGVSEPNRAKDDAPARTPHILVIESNEEDALLLTDVMQRMDYEVSARATGQEGLGYLGEHQPDVIILSLNLPDMSGAELVNRIQSLAGHEHSAILVTASESDYTEESIIAALASGVNEFMGKPIRQGELLMRVGNLLELKWKERSLTDMGATLERERTILSRYFSEDFVSDVLNERISAELGGTIQRATILFFDLRKSTVLAELLPADQFASMLSTLMNDLMEMVFASGGSVNKLIGDGLLATFGLPVPQDEAAANAVQTALKIREYFKTLNELPPFDLPFSLDYGIGIATGDVFAGNIGSFRRMEYTVLGDPVNTASRIEGLTKRAGVHILIDTETREAVQDRFPGMIFRVFESNVRGKELRLRVHNPALERSGGVHFF